MTRPQQARNPQPMKVWIDGRVVDASEARVPVTDHGLLYGDGIFEGIRIYSRSVFRLDDHLRGGLSTPQPVLDGQPRVRPLSLDAPRPR